MSKYDPLWESVRKSAGDRVILSFDEMRAVLGFEIDHSFLNFKKELPAYGWRVGKISLKGRTAEFVRIGTEGG